MTQLVQSLTDAVALGAVYCLIALGIALVFGVMRLINFAHGELIMGAGYGAFLFTGDSWLIAIPGSIAVATILAVAMERVAFRPLRNASPATLFVGSFALSFLLQNVALLIFGARPKPIVPPSVFDGVFVVEGVKLAKLGLLTVVVTALLVGALAAFLNRTTLGVQMRAAADDFRMAQLLGVKANSVIAAAFAVSGFLAGIAGLLLVWRSGSVSPTMGLTPVLVGFVAVVVGGLGNVWAAAAGAFLLGIVTVELQTYIPVDLRQFRDALVFTLVIAVLVARPHGFVGKPETARV